MDGTMGDAVGLWSRSLRRSPPPSSAKRRTSPPASAKRASPTKRGEGISPTKRGEGISPTKRGEGISPTKRGERTSPPASAKRASPTKRGEAGGDAAGQWARPRAASVSAASVSSGMAKERKGQGGGSAGVVFADAGAEGRGSP
eukprot:641567-Prorocentrum_minimum.AAC.1